MRVRSHSDPRLTELTRRRLEQLSAEIAGARRMSPPVEPSDSGSLESLPSSFPDVDHPRPFAAPAPAPGRHARRPVDRGSRVGGWLSDRLPPTLQGRVGLGAAQFAVLAVAVAAGLAVTAWWVLRAGNSGELVPAAAPWTAAAGGTALPISSGAPSAGPVAATPAPAGATTRPSGVLVVDVTGMVRHPGIASLPAGARVVDAVRAAGGLRPGVDRAGVNFARPLVDGEQIVVRRAGETGPLGLAAATTPAPAGSTLVNLNTADQAALESLPGVGPVTAQAILSWREENGAFRAVDELLDVSGIGAATLAEIAPFVTL